MGLLGKIPDNVNEVDVIIAGGGAAGCVVASRLASASADLSILVIESGPNNRDEPLIKHPAAFMAHLQPNSFNKFYYSHPSKHLNGKQAPVGVGKVLGGGTSINTLMYTRPQASDLDDWKTSGWSGQDLLPYYKKMEKYGGEGDRAYHGLDGPVEITRGIHVWEKSRDDLLQAANSQGWTEKSDLQSMQPDAAHGSQKALRYVSKEGIRQDAATCYLHPRLEDGKHPNLDVLVESQVVKVILQDGKAVGVTYSSAESEGNSPAGNVVEREVRARKLVVLSAGAFGSAAILERSGIGASDVLKAAGVPLVHDLPGVGCNYMDHTIALSAYNTNFETGETMDIVARSGFETLAQQKSPLLSSNAQDVNIKGRPSEEEVKALGPEFEEFWRENFAERKDKPLGWMSFVSGFPGYDPSIDASRQYMGMLYTSAYPASSGYAHITGPSLSDQISFDAGYLSDERQVDIKMLVWLYKKGRELMRRMSAFRGEFATWHPAFPKDSKAACIITNEPLPTDVADIEYTAEDDVAIEAFMRDSITTMNHSMGTCKMAPEEQGGVVSPALNVHGVTGLKVADLSIVPSNVSANTASTALAIGEKAADLILGELGLAK